MNKKWIAVIAFSALLLGACGTEPADIRDVSAEAESYKKAAEIKAPDAYSEDFLLDTSIFMSEIAEHAGVLNSNVAAAIEDGSVSDEKAVRKTIDAYTDFASDFELQGDSETENVISDLAGEIEDNMSTYIDYIEDYLEEPKELHNTTLESAQSRVMRLAGDMSSALADNGAQPALADLKEQFDALHYNPDFSGFKGNFVAAEKNN
ncbi:MAG: hypothetical protein ACI33O_02190 [Bhargavaea sp.]